MRLKGLRRQQMGGSGRTLGTRRSLICDLDHTLDGSPVRRSGLIQGFRRLGAASECGMDRLQSAGMPFIPLLQTKFGVEHQVLLVELCKQALL
jgi:hypothetical protein